jgi:hypothetical protein
MAGISPGLLTCLTAIVFTAAASARAGEIPIDVSSLVNAPWEFSGCGGYITNGDTFPTGDQNLGGVPLAIPNGPNNARLGAVAADCGEGFVSLTIPVGVQGVTSVFTLLNTFWASRARTLICLSLSPGVTARALHNRSSAA